MTPSFLFAVGFLIQGPDTTLLHDAWQNLWRRPFDSSAVAFLRAAEHARTTRNRSALSSAYTGIGFISSRLVGAGPALAQLDTAVRMAPPEAPAVEALARCTRATIMSFAGQEGATEDARAGLGRATRGGGDRALGLCYFALGSVGINESAQPAAVLALLDSAAVKQRAAGDDDWLSITLFTRGYLLQFIGDLAGSKDALSEAREVAARTQNLFTASWVHRFLGDVHAATGDWISADAEYRAGYAGFGRLKDGLGLRGIRRVVASAEAASGRLDAAESSFLQLRAEAESAGFAEAVYGAALELAIIKWLRGDIEGSHSETERAAEFGMRTGHQGMVTSLGYSRGLCLRKGRLDQAERYLRDWLRGLPPGQLQNRYAARARLAEVLVRRGRLDQGHREILSAMNQLDSLRATLRDPALRTLVFQTRNSFDEPDLGLATIAAALVRSGRVEEAFDLSERRRARMLAERMVRERLAVSGAPSTRRMGAGAPAAVADLKATLPAGSALVEFLAGYRGQPTIAFILTRDNLSAEILSPLDSLAPDAERLIALLAAGEPAPAPARRLGEALIDPVVRRLPADIRVLRLVLDGFLHRLPLDALILADGRPMLDRFALAVVPSAAVALALQGQAPRIGAAEVLAFGDPQFAREGSPNGDVTAQVFREAFDSSGGLPRLPASAAEARNVVRYSSKGVLRLRSGASEAFLKGVPPDRFRVVHFATHALVDERSPARTALALAPGDGEDGFLGPGELASLALGADLIVLSACRTAGGAVVEGEGIQGLTAPFFEGGARAVVATMWPVADQKAASLTAEFYAALARGLPVGEALRAAKLARRAAGAGVAEWAAFAAIGDPMLLISLRAPRSVPTFWWVVGGLIATAVVFLVAQRLRAGSLSAYARPS